MSQPYEVSAEARILHQESLVIDACSFFCREYGDNLRDSGITAVALTTPWPWDTFDPAVQRTEAYYQLVRQDSRFRLVETVDDIGATREQGQVGIILFAQSPSPIGDRLARVETLARLGYRIVQLTYSERNNVGDGCHEPSNVGLSLFGRALVKELNQSGIVVDLSHAGPRTGLEAVELSTQPVIISHTSPHTLHPNPRTANDELIDAVADSGGVIGLTPFVTLNWNSDPDHQPTLDDFLNAVDYVVDRVGIDHVGIGSDSEATEGAYPPALRAELGRRYPNLSGPYFETFGADAPRHVLGFRGLRDFPRITAGLLERGYQSDDVRKILGENFLRVYTAVWHH